MREEILVYIGTYTDPVLFGTGQVLQGKGKGIYLCRLDLGSGRLEPVATETGITNPSYLAFDRTDGFLYAVNELKEFEGKPTGTVSAFAVDPKNHRLRYLNRQPTHGTDPCHVLVADGLVFVANFMSGSVCVLPVRDDGSLGKACDFVQHIGSSIDPARQRGPHAHSAILAPDGRFVFVPDLGLDKLVIYRLDAACGRLEPHAVPWIKTRPGAGPRHVAFHPSGRLAFLVNELDSTLTSLSYDPAAGRFEELHVVPTLPDGFAGQSTCADVQVAPSGRHVYASNRGHDTIATFAVDLAKGRLELIAHQATGGRTPRSFGIDPSGRFLLAANQDTDSVVTFRIDPERGTLRETGHVAPIPTPVCVKFLS